MSRGQQPKNNSEKVVVSEVIFEVVEGDVEPPPPHLTSRLKTVQDWLLTICDNDKPQKQITKYKFGLFESPTAYTLVLVGVNTYDEGKNRSVTHVEFESTNLYFKLPDSEYKNLSRDQLIDKWHLS